MNLHAIVANAVGAVNPTTFCTVKMSVGYTTNPDGTQVPAYSTFDNVPCQSQALTYNDIVQTEGLSIQGIRRAIYLTGEWSALNRAEAKGGDLILMPELNGTVTTWLIAIVLENWPTWCKIAATMQNGS